MQNFETPHLQRMRNAGLAVYSEKVADLDGSGNAGIRVTASDDCHKLWLYSLNGKWVVKTCLPNAASAPCSFLLEFDSADEVIANAIEYFRKDDRWKAVNEYLEGER
jgi:hypothetical protein